MTSKSWSRRSVLVCAISLVVCAAAQPVERPAKAPCIALLDETDAERWQVWTRQVGWQVVSAPPEPDANIDRHLQTLANKVDEGVKSGVVDPARVYLAGRGQAAGTVFYAIARMPDRWAAGVALGGSPKSAIDTNRVFAANFTNTPVLWASSGADDQALADKLKTAGVNLEWRSSDGLTNSAIFNWLSAHTREEFPASIDCETNSPAFASCYWIRMTKFDANERNDVLPATLVPGDSGAALDLGGFGYKADEPGPGVTVAFLPEKYSGPLKAGDRLVALDGKPIENARQLVRTLTQAVQTRPAVVMIERLKDRIRIETRIVVPRRDPVITARVKASHLPDFHQIEIITRAVTEMNLVVPPAWVPGDLFWNGLSLENLKTAGCYTLKIEKELLRAGPCQ